MKKNLKINSDLNDYSNGILLQSTSFFLNMKGKIMLGLQNYLH